MVSPRTQGSFVVRIWLEGESAHNPTWRGHIRHVQGEEESYFQSLSKMKEFLERISGVPLPEKEKDKVEGFSDE